MIPPALLRLGAGLLLPLLAAAGGYALGSGQSRQYWQTRLQATVAEMQSADSRAQQQRQAAAMELQRQWRQRIDQLESRLLEQQQALQAQQRRNAQRIDDVTRNDGPRFTGLGPDSLRLYRQLLGYADELPGAQPLSAGAAAQTPGADAGLPAPDLLAHAADYGAWCQQLEQRLVALKQLYSQQEPTP
ncbi:hypothetical protein [Chromobacterium violaceum]|uniref:Uncharacterized protein n=1 Tax=Chromobacterium violaceum TaxID=536 RepID=A0AAX2MF46_CHRVL|nr:hypothetical protein [Chromobacterium violaceum]MBX9269124.1 hypothetical protein [Chromobacterium violaceum]OLZ78905.1 hypothetical protein BS642_12585 [Chromobacterium violaceum]OQS08554.1 hypothetical protein B0T38_19415 [Chromobacterium violaceum]OQS22007.1 hypothetical protein B0T37_19010 [Chromobacterium violaceum]OQS45621.1 hypothetical protein B0T48_18545 [Chromobacterium violaceum]